MTARMRYVKGELCYFIGRRKVGRDEYNAYLSTPRKRTQSSARWPMASVAAGCHPDQVPEAIEVAARKGVPTEYTPSGKAVFRDRAHRKAFLAAHNMRDNDGGYSDG